MSLQELEFAALERQATHIDSLDRYLRACRRRGTTDEVALQEYRRAVRTYRRRLAALGPDLLFQYARRVVPTRQT